MTDFELTAPLVQAESDPNQFARLRIARLKSSKSNEWYTPPEYIEAARKVMGQIDLDPASCAEANKVVKAARFYTIDDDGLTQPWTGRLFLNPPYGRRLGDSGPSNAAVWTARLRAEYGAGNVTQACVLIGANTETDYYQALCEFPVCLPKGRIQFYGPDSEADNNTNGSAIFYLGPNVMRFAEVFRQFGAVQHRLAAPLTQAELFGGVR